MQKQYLTIEALTKYIEKKFDADPYMKKVFVKGEISNFKQPLSGHLYFTLKDEAAMLRSVMFAKSAQKLSFRPEDGMNVLVSGRIGVFTKAGRYQFYAEEMEPDGVGALYVRFEQLKAKLEQEGLFAETHKKALPSFPSKVAVVTSATGAAVRDILTTIQRRMPATEVVLYPTMVQGDGAAEKIARNIARINARHDIDVMIIGRGGGSLEELWAFNEEIVVRSVYDSDIPIISAVGHETDFSLTDFTADMRAATPTAAAEIAVPNQHDLKERILEREYRLTALVHRRLERENQLIRQQSDRLAHVSPARTIETGLEKIDYFAERLKRSYSRFILIKEKEYQTMRYRFEKQSPKERLVREKREWLLQKDRLSRLKDVLLERKKEQLIRLSDGLEYLSPLALLKRGYGLTKKDDHVIKTIQEIEIDDQVEVTMQGGRYQAKVTAKEESGYGSEKTNL